MGFSRQEYWSGLPFPSPGALPNPGIEPRSSAFRADCLPSEPFVGSVPWVMLLKITSFFPHNNYMKKCFLSLFYRLINGGLRNHLGLPLWLSGKLFTCHCKRHFQCRRHKRLRFNPWVRKIPWRRAWHPTPVFLPGQFHGQRSLVAYSRGLQRVGHDLETNSNNKEVTCPEV